MLAALFATLIAQAATDSPAADAATIRNSGSTNTAGYTIVVKRDFTADVTQNGTTTTAAVAAAQAKWLFAKLREAAPLDALPGRTCMKSASFGSSTTIAYAGATTPDLSCATNAAARELNRTIGVIAQQLGVGGFRRGLRPAQPPVRRP